MPSAMPRATSSWRVPPAVVALVGIDRLLVAPDQSQEWRFVRDMAGREDRVAHQARALVDREVHLVAERGFSGMAFQLASWSLRPSTGSPWRGRRESASRLASIRVPLLTISPRPSRWRLSSASTRSLQAAAPDQLGAKARQGRVVRHRVGQC
jgi:hypothetical protein